ncbi:hypothetical protein GW17_00004498 [Ensete ventricosum]|nr:hypothetical protein GW17_00004498 [Ensete ventricosum]RZS28120.1 hypothetical protein BHM03_00061682 [Ensete ventricosum]
MGPLCDFCGEQRPMVYCRSDAASLCLSCDRKCPFCKCPFLEALAKSFARQMQYATCDNLVHRRKCFSLSKLRSEWSWWFLISFRTQKADDKLLFRLSVSSRLFENVVLYLQVTSYKRVQFRTGIWLDQCK